MGFIKTFTLIFKNIIRKNLQSKNTITLADAIKKYLRHLNASGFSDNTIYCYSKDLVFLSNYFRDSLLKKITTELIDNFLISIKNTGSTKSLNTINRSKSAYRSFFKWCFLQEYLYKDFSLYIRLSKSNSEKTTAIKPDEIKKLLNTISKYGDSFSKRDKALFAIYAFSGIRKSEALALRVCDFDSELGIIFLHKSKGSSRRAQKIPSVLTKILDEYINQILAIKNIENVQPLFSGQKQRPFLSPRQASNRFEKWKKESGIRKNLTIHSFRAGYATEIYKNYRDLLLVSFSLGHHSAASTKRYINDCIFNIDAVLEKTFNLIT